MARKALFFTILAGGLAWSVTAIAGQDLAYLTEGNRVPSAVAVGDSLSLVDLDEQRGSGASIPMPQARTQAGGPVAVILWDEVSKGRTQNSGANNVGTGMQSTNVRN
ncbi:MAG: hypothetical protein U1F33_04095 [Alphaproteobacteria bacterium]